MYKGVFRGGVLVQANLKKREFILGSKESKSREISWGKKAGGFNCEKKKKKWGVVRGAQKGEPCGIEHRQALYQKGGRITLS